jgi:hypothetical protein
MGKRLAVVVVMSMGFVGACLAQVPAEPAATAPAKPAKYPLRLHVLAIDDTHKTVRMQPNWCAGSLPDPDAGGAGGGCGNDASTSLGGGDDDFTGSGRADLVSPPDGTVGMDFTYEGCNRVRVAPGFQGLQARWIKPGKKLEVLVPTDAVTDGPDHLARCTLKVTAQEFVYLRLHNGTIIKVSQAAYWKKPSLRMYLSGGSEQLERRRNTVVSVKELARPAQP